MSNPCTACGVEIETPKHIITSIRSARVNVLQFCAFCSDACREAWWTTPEGDLATAHSPDSLTCPTCQGKTPETCPNCDPRGKIVPMLFCSHDDAHSGFTFDRDITVSICAADGEDVLPVLDAVFACPHDVNDYWRSEEPDAITERIAARETARQAEAAAALTPEAEALGLP